MHPRESIPNVGRRARGHRAATFTLKGNSVNRTTSTIASTTTPTIITTAATTKNAITTTTPTTPTKVQPSETDDVHGNNDHARRRCAECGCLEDEERVGGGGDDSLHFYHHHHHHFHHHPYSRILQRLARRRQVSTEPQTHNRIELDPQGDYIPSTVQATTRAGRNFSNPHANDRPPQNRSPRTDDQLRWQGSNAVRRNHQLEEMTRLQLPRAKVMDVSGGCLTGRNLTGSHDGVDSRPETMPDTTRSEPADVSRLSREAAEERATGGKKAEFLDELFDYYWVYQGMGRQVLNLDLPREVWDRKLLMKPAIKLPPISSQDITHKSHERPREKGRLPDHAGRERQRSEHASPGRRSVSDSACTPILKQSQVSGVVPMKLVQRRSEVSNPNNTTDLGVDQKRSSPLTRRNEGSGTSHTATRKKLVVVKMPVLTKDKTLADLLPDKDG